MKSTFLSLITLIMLMAACSNYGKKIEAEGGDVFYKNGISEAQAQQVADFLSNNSFFSKDQDKRSVQLLLDDNKIAHINFVIKEDYLDNASTISLLKTLGFQTAYSILKLDTINIDMCDPRFKTLKLLPLGIIRFGDNAMIYTDAVEKAAVANICNFMMSANYIKEKDGFVFVTDKESNTYQLKMASKEGAETNPNIVANVSKLSLDLSHNILDNQPVNFWFLDDGLIMKRVINFQDMLSMEQ